MQSITTEEAEPFWHGPSAQEDTHEHLLSPPESRGLNAPVTYWRVYPISKLVNSNIGDTLVADVQQQVCKVYLTQDTPESQQLCNILRKYFEKNNNESYACTLRFE